MTWISDDDVINHMYIVAPEACLDPNLRAALDHLTEVEKIVLEGRLWDARLALEEQIKTEMPFKSKEESAFAQLKLPRQFSLTSIQEGSSIDEALLAQIARTPKRWQLDQLWALVTYLWNHGPSLKLKRKWIRRRLRKTRPALKSVRCRAARRTVRGCQNALGAKSISEYAPIEW